MPSAHYAIEQHEQTQLCADLYSELEKRDDLSDIEKKMFVDLFYNKEKSRDVQMKYGVTPKDVANAKVKILKIMKTQLAEKYGITRFSDVYEC